VVGELGVELQDGGELAEETAFISRTNAPLVATALDCLTKKIDFEILGRDLSEEMNDVIADIVGGQEDRKQVPIYMLIPRLDDYIRKEGDLLKSEFKDDTRRHKEFKKNSEAIDSIKSVMGYVESVTRSARKMDGTSALTDYVNPKEPSKTIKTIEDFVWYLRKQFGGVETENADAMTKFMDRKKRNGKKFVTLTTAHRSKGMEWDRVFIAGADKFAWPDQPGVPGEEEMDTEEQQQEWNALYVALTRAKRGLHVLADKADEIGQAA
jgi:superfamily I DNA/RNA helicase